MAGIEDEIAALEDMGAQELRRRWRRFYHTEHPAGLSRDLQTRAIAYKMQERVHGGLPQHIKRKLRTLARQLETASGGKFKPGIMLKPGAKLIREWAGRPHRVVVLEDGFDYEGRRYPSLSAIAREITGVRWSGPRFFGIRRALRPFSSAGTEAPHEHA